jgi:hypothetical protein
MPITYEFIASTTLATTSNVVEFTNIPGTYTDLVLYASLRTNEAQIESNATISFNGSGANKNSRTLYGGGTGTGNSYTYADNIYIWTSGASATASIFGNAIYHIPNYTTSNAKTVSIDSTMEHNGTCSMALTAGLWDNTAAVTSITITSGGGNFVQHSSAYLYGITKS